MDKAKILDVLDSAACALEETAQNLYQGGGCSCCYPDGHCCPYASGKTRAAEIRTLIAELSVAED